MTNMSDGLSKAQNKHSRIWGRMEPLSKEIVNDIESGIYDWQDQKEIKGKIADMFEIRDGKYSKVDKIWFFEPESFGSNMIINAYTGMDPIL